MSPYVVPDHVLERKLPTSLTPTFWGALTVVSFDSLDEDSPRSSVIPENHLVAQLSTSSKESENAIALLSKPVSGLGIPHPYLYFDDGNITLRVRLCAFQRWYLLTWLYIHRFREFTIAFIGLYFVADRRNSRISFRSFPRSKSLRPPQPFL